MPFEFDESVETYTLIRDKDKALSLMQCYNNDSMLDDLDQRNVIDDKYDDRLVANAENYVEQIAYLGSTSKALKSIFELAINYLLVLPSARASGGSSSAMPGVIWINPKEHWENLDRRELLVHELTHNLLFTDELVNVLYKYEGMADRSNWTYSAVLGKQRPVDKSFHSSVVATEILLYRNDADAHPETPKAHPPTEKLLKQTYKSISECEKSSLLENRGREILLSCKESLNKIYH